jgi:beta-phosphoglucomutase
LLNAIYHSTADTDDMSLKAVLFDFNGVIIQDESIHDRLLQQLLIEENLRPKPEEFRQLCLGRPDRDCIQDLFSARGRVLAKSGLDALIARKTKAYQKELGSLEKLPIYPGVEDLIFNVRASQLKLAVVSGALQAEVTLVLDRMGVSDHFSAIASSDDNVPGKPEPAIYLLAVERLNQHHPELNLKPSECLAIEDTFAGITAAKQAGIPVVGVANTYPFHMLQRRANWTVDYLSDLELERVQQVYELNAA